MIVHSKSIVVKIICWVFIGAMLYSPILVYAETTYAGGSSIDLYPLESKSGSSQVIIVSTNNESDVWGKLSTYQKVNGQWQQVFSPMETMIGAKGLSESKAEGDKKSPAGIFELGQAFGTAQKPVGIKLPYTQTTAYDYWVDDVSSSDYNKWVSYKGDPDKRWWSYEKLLIPCYKYAVVIKYNMNPIEKGKGSAIFLHKFSGNQSGSLGCTEVSEENILKILKWLDPVKKPIIIQGTDAMIRRMLSTLNVDIKVLLDGKIIAFDVKPRIIKERTLVPLRAIFEAWGAEVLWNDEIKEVTAIKNDIVIKLKANSNEATVNGRKVLLDVPATIIDSRTFVPVRFISESYGADVNWDDGNKTVLISSK